MLGPEAGEGAEAVSPAEVQGRPCPLGGGGGRPRCPRRAPGAAGAEGSAGAVAPLREGLTARRSGVLPVCPYRSGRLKEQGGEKGTEENGGKLRNKIKDQEKSIFFKVACKDRARFPAVGKQPAAAVFILLSWFAIYQKYVLIIPRGMRDPG